MPTLTTLQPIHKVSAMPKKFIVEDDNSLLMFENEQIMLVKNFKGNVLRDIIQYREHFTSYGRMKTNNNDYSCIFGQIDKLEWIHYPRDGRDCKLLILGDKEWISGKVVTYGECTFSPILEKLSKSVNVPKNEYSILLKELKALGINDFSETYQINVTLEFIPESVDSETLTEPESPLDEIRRDMNSI
jgi:hypothetical protein